jgi:hypothetical protein
MTTTGESAWSRSPTSPAHDFHDLRARWWHDDGEWKAEAGDPDTGDEYLRLVNEAFGSAIPRQTWVDIRKAAMDFRPDVADSCLVRRPTRPGHAPHQ